VRREKRREGGNGERERGRGEGKEGGEMKRMNITARMTCEGWYEEEE
jgi:hypothetical protein